MGFNLLNAIEGAAPGLLTGNPLLALEGGVTSAFGGGGPSGFGNLNPNDPTVGAQQVADRAYEAASLGLNIENMRHNYALQVQSTMFNELQDERSEQMREMNVLREVAMKQREADNSIVKEFIKTIKD